MLTPPGHPLPAAPPPEIPDAPGRAHGRFAPLLTQALEAVVSEEGFTTSERPIMHTIFISLPLRPWLSITKAALTVHRNSKNRWQVVPRHFVQEGQGR